MKTIFFAGPLAGGVLRDLKVEPGEGKDLLILPDIPAMRQARAAFANTDSAPFITTFGDLARRHRVAARKRILSPAGGIILMRKAAKRLPDGVAKRKKLTAQLLALGANLKQNGMSASEILKKSGVAGDAGRKLAMLEPALTDFEAQMKKAAMTDDTGALLDLASAIKRKRAGGISGKFHRIIAAGFHALTPSHLKVLSAAEDCGIETLEVTADPEQKRGDGKNPSVFLRSFDFLTNEAHHAAAEIRKKIDGGARVTDFAVIVRQTAGRAPLIAGVFERNGVPVTVQSGCRLGAESSISAFLKDCFAAAQNPDGREFERFKANPVLRRFFGKGPAKMNELKTILAPLRLKDGKPVKAGAIFKTLSEIVDATGAYKAAESDPSVEDMRMLLREAVFLSEKWNEGFTSPGDFADFLSELLQSRAYSYKTPGAGEHVAVMDAFQARGTSYPFVFILDCRDGVFPYPGRTGGVFNDDEKRDINRRCGARALITDTEHLKDERAIWLCAVACAEREIHISFSRKSSGAGNENAPSLFIGELRQTRAVEEPEEGAGMSENPYCPEIARARAFESFGEIPLRIKKLLEKNDPFAALAEPSGRGAAAEKERLMENGVFGKFEGVVAEPKNNRWELLRVTEIEKFGDCPFQFFCSKALGIKEKEPEAEIPSAMDTGALYHDTLKHIFSSDAEVWKSDEETDVALRVFLDDKKTKKMHCKVSDAVWELQKERARFLLGGFIGGEKHRIAEKGLVPEFFEREIEMEIEGAKISGRIDRVDKDKNGGLHVVDYKKKGLPPKFCSRKYLQVPLYLAAISSELKARAECGSYLSVEKRDKVEKNADGNGILKKAEALAGENIKLMKTGFFPAVPLSKPDDFPRGEDPMVLKKERGVCDLCSYSDICRIKESVVRKWAGE